MAGSKSWFKVNILEVQEKILLFLKWFNWGNLMPKINTSEHFSKSVHKFF